MTRPSWPTVAVAVAAIAASVALAFAGHPEHVEAAIVGALALMAPNRWKAAPQ